MVETNGRLDEVEARLARIEDALARLEPRSVREPSPPSAAPHRPSPLPAPAPAKSIDPTKVMAWAASFAFILATGYFVKLVYDAGWLTPERQVAMAALVGLSLIGGGLALERRNREYAAYMPAVGIVVLYVCVYAAHIFYGFFGIRTAMAGVAAITLAATWLGSRFNNNSYSLIAVVGTYMTPLLVDSVRTDIFDLVVYSSAWGLLFSFVALQQRRRAVYLLALFFALIGFDIAFRMTDKSNWQIAAVYQSAQFLVFSATAAFFSIRHRRPMDGTEATVHGLALFYFYAIEFILLKQNAPGWASPIALASVGVVAALYFAARRSIDASTSLRAGATLVSSYCSVVTAHIVFFELMPDGWHPWAALLLPVAVALARQQMSSFGGAMLPIVVVGGGLFGVGFLEGLVATPGSSDVPYPGPLLFLYAASLYVTYALFRKREESFLAAPVPLYAAHIALLTATVRAFDGAFAISIAWALAALIALTYAVKRDDRVVGQSSLIIFAASGLKVLLFDLSNSAPMLRVLTLVVLAVSLYGGGWLYQQMSKEQEDYHSNPAVNAQLRLIKRLIDEGLDDVAIAAELERQGVRRLGSEHAWSAAPIEQIRRDYNFS